ncbi:MAG: SPOR domain-containing protein [Saprospiraceae bacterium]
MKSLLKFLGMAALLVLAGLWIMTVAKSCDNKKTVSATQLEENLKNKVTEVKDDVEDLFDEDEGLFNEEGDEILADESDKEGIDETEEEDDNDEDSNNPRNVSNTSTGGSTATSSGMEYMVIGGAFLTEANAKAEVRRLKRKGYNDAEVVVFDYSQYHSVCVDRARSAASAEDTKSKLIRAGYPEAYVHKKRRYSTSK